MFKLIVRLALMAMVTPLIAPGASAQAKFPERTIRLVVPFVAGGGVDTYARLIAQRLQDKLGGAVIVENRAGANSTLGGNYVMQAAPDGYTLLFSASTHISARLVMAKAPYDPIADFTPIARVGLAPMLVIMAPNKPQRTFAEVVEAARKQPAEWSAATPALGSPGHLATIAFANLAGFTPQIIPYRGTAPALNDVAGGHVQLYIDAMIALLPMAQAGSVKPLAITGKNRSKLAPEIPTTAEGGMPDLDIHSWYAVWGPKGMPDELVKRLNGIVNEITAELAWEGKLDALGIEVVAETPEQFARFEADDVARNAALLKSVNFQPE
ncbi:MAG: Bug family tripartite tricarboxylate transporter substrate binding protein [Xanthobacteraceae bacterium]